MGVFEFVLILCVIFFVAAPFVGAIIGLCLASLKVQEKEVISKYVNTGVARIVLKPCDDDVDVSSRG